MLRRAIPILLPDAAPVPGRDCPEPATLLDLARYRLAAGEAEAVRAHVAICRSCAESLAQIVTHPAVEPAADDELSAIAAARSRWLPRWRRRKMLRNWLSGAALAAGLAAIAISLRPGVPPVPSSTPPTATRRPPAPGPSLPVLLLPHEGEQLGALNPEFRWQEVPGALSYTLTLLDHDGDILWQESTTGSSLRLREGLVLETGASYFAWVTVRFVTSHQL